MPTVIEGFSQVEYLIVFNAIVFGVIAGEYFGGWGNMLRHRIHIKFSLIHFLWTAFAFLTLIQNWFGIWPRTKFINDNVLFFFFSLIPLLLFHLLSVVLFPNLKLNQAFDLEKYYMKNSRVIFVLFAIYLFSTILGSYVYDDKGNVLVQNLIRLSGVILCLLCAYFKKKQWLHYLFLFTGYSGLILFLTQIPK